MVHYTSACIKITNESKPLYNPWFVISLFVLTCFFFKPQFSPLIVCSVLLSPYFWSLWLWSPWRSERWWLLKVCIRMTCQGVLGSLAIILTHPYPQPAVPRPPRSHGYGRHGDLAAVCGYSACVSHPSRHHLHRRMCCGKLGLWKSVFVLGQKVRTPMKTKRQWTAVRRLFLQPRKSQHSDQ